MWGPKALDTATFLIDQDRGIAPSDSLAKFIDQAMDLPRVFDVAGKQDQSPRMLMVNKIALVTAK
jgi:hypothetical protein